MKFYITALKNRFEIDGRKFAMIDSIVKASGEYIIDSRLTCNGDFETCVMWPEEYRAGEFEICRYDNIKEMVYSHDRLVRELLLRNDWMDDIVVKDGYELHPVLLRIMNNSSCSCP